MGKAERVDRRLDEFEELLQRLGDVETRLARVRTRRSAVPASLLLFIILAFVLLREQIASTSPAGFVWFILFGAGYVTLLTVNEATARRAIPSLEGELKTLQGRFERQSESGHFKPASEVRDVRAVEET